MVVWGGVVWGGVGVVRGVVQKHKSETSAGSVDVELAPEVGERRVCVSAISSAQQSARVPKCVMVVLWARAAHTSAMRRFCTTGCDLYRLILRSDLVCTKLLRHGRAEMQRRVYLGQERNERRLGASDMG